MSRNVIIALKIWGIVCVSIFVLGSFAFLLAELSSLVSFGRCEWNCPHSEEIYEK